MDNWRYLLKKGASQVVIQSIKGQHRLCIYLYVALCSRVRSSRSALSALGCVVSQAETLVSRIVYGCANIRELSNNDIKASHSIRSSNQIASIRRHKYFSFEYFKTSPLHNHKIGAAVGYISPTQS